MFLYVVGTLIVKSPDFQKGYQMGKSLQNTSQDIPKGNAHWDKSQDLFTQMKKETDVEKIKKLNDQNIPELKAVLDELPNNARVWSELGNAYTWASSLDPKAQLDLGLVAYKKAEELDPTNPVYINNVGDQLILMQRYDEAILQFQKTLRLTPNSGYANLSLCKAYTGSKVYNSARESCQKAIDIFTGENQEGKYDQQILDSKKAMAAIPK